MFGFLSKKPVQIAIVVLLTTLAYSNIFQNDFVSDDRGFVKRWASTQKLANIPNILSGKGPPFRQEATYRPIRDSLYVIYYQIFGENTFGWHLHSIMVQVGVTVLVYLIVGQLIKLIKADLTDSVKQFLPFTTAVLFGVHPIHTESITFMTSSMDMIGPMFMFGSFYLYLKVKTPISADSKLISADKMLIMRIASVVLAGLAFFSYELTLVLPILLILADQVLIKPIKTDLTESVKSALFRYGPYFAVALIYMAVRIFLIERMVPEEGYWISQAKDYSLLLEPEIFLKYLTLLFLPVNLSFNHVIGPNFDTFSTFINTANVFDSYSFWNLKTYFGLFSFLALIFGAILAFKKHHLIVTFGILWYLISQLPFANLWPQPTVLAERYLFVPSFGFVLVLAYIILKLPKIFKTSLFILIVLTYLSLTLIQNSYWRNKFVIWEKVSEVYPSSGLAYYNFANLNVEDNNIEKAIDYSQKALEINPQNYYYLFNLGDIYFEKAKNNQKAIEAYLKAISIYPSYDIEVYLALAEAYLKEGFPKKAVETLKSAIAIGWEQTHLNRQHYDFTMNKIYKKLDEISLKDPTLWSMYKGPFGISFNYPPSWKQEVSDGLVILTSRDDFYHLEVSFGEFGSDFEFAKYVESQPEDLGSLVISEPVEINNIPLAYIRVFDDGKIHKLQFFLFKKGRIIKIVVYPSVSELKQTVDGLVSTIKILE